MRIPSSVPLQIDELLGDDDAREFVLDCLQREPFDLVGRRLRQAAPWIQSAFDALAFPEAVLGLGVALESLIGSEGTSDVVRTVGVRTAFLLRVGETPAERALSASDWRTKASALYKARSTVAHGRYEPGTLDTVREAKIRNEFESLVCTVAAKFRAEGRRCEWQTDKDLKAWQEQLELG
jgi:hypothetical protein